MSRNIKKSLVSNDDNKSKFFLNKLKRTGEMSAWLAGKSPIHHDISEYIT